MTDSKRIFVSNRLPFGLDKKTDQMTRGSGGLVSALLGVSLEQKFAWFGFETDKSLAPVLQERAGELNPNMSCHPVLIEKDLYHSYYDGLANDLLWPLFHYESQYAQFDRGNWESYRVANQLMADAILRAAKPGDTVWIHDFHFLLLPEMLKKVQPQLKVGFFLHIPFPSVEIFRQLPVREDILRSLTCCDLVGFHEYSYLRHFSDCLKAFLSVDSTLFKVRIGGHTLNLGVYPISIDTQGYRKKASTPEIYELTESFRHSLPSPFTILGIDRLDYTKGLELKLKGFQQALSKYPELVGKVSLLQVAVPSRQNVPIYQAVKAELDQLVGAINGDFSRPSYIPVQYIFNSVSEDTLLALYKRADAALVTSKRDGMNLVAMEFVMAQDTKTPGVLILSEFAGAASILGDATLINPWDVDSIADAIYGAYKMSTTEKKARLANMQKTLSDYSSTNWAENFLTDLEDAFDLGKAEVPTRDLNTGQWPEELVTNLSRQKVRLIVDYDGTLVRIQERPESVSLMEDMRDVLLQLNEFMDVIILSGRNKNFLASEFEEMPFMLAAEHGAFSRRLGERWRSRISSDIKSWYADVEHVMASYTKRVPFSFVEKKEASLVWHYRQSPEQFSEYQAKRLDDELKVCLANQPVSISMGSKIVEAKATECNKGSFIRWLKQQTPMDKHLHICIGDDVTDEDMFRQCLGTDDISFKVGPGLTSAKYRIQAQDQLLEHLENLLDICHSTYLQNSGRTHS